jgi:hypothetical protein
MLKERSCNSPIYLSRRGRDLEGLGGAGEMMTGGALDSAFQLPVEDVADDAAISRHLLLLPSSFLFYSRERCERERGTISLVGCFFAASSTDLR